MILTSVEDEAIGLQAVRRGAQDFITNLLINAKEALAAAGEKTIRLHSFGRGGAVVLRVKDNGPGIPAAHLGRLFDPFFTTKGAAGGMGMGLSISHGIVKDHGGEIHVASVEGSEATVAVELPAASASEP